MKKLLYFLIFTLIPVYAFSQIKYDTLNVKQIGEGAFHYSIVAPSVPWTLEVVEIDLTNDTYSLETVKANDRLTGYEKTSSMSSRKSKNGHRVIAAINGDFYGGGGIPTNLQVLKGEMLRTPINREVFGYSNNGTMFINTISYEGVLKIGEATNPLNDVNAVRNNNEIVFYNHFYGPSTFTNEFGTELTLKAIDPWVVNGEVRSIVVSKSENAGNSTLTDSTFVLSGHGTSSSILANVLVGDTLSINHKIIPGTDKIKEAVGGSRKFLNGGVNQGNWPERHPRSALGFNADTTKFYLVTVDGRQSSSSGMTLTELGEFMKGFGAHYALNLDGGGSTTLVVHEEIVNSPSDGGLERSVSNALMIVSNKSRIGSVDHIKLSPSINRIYRNKSFIYEVTGMDSNYFPVELSSQEIRFSLSEGFDAEISEDGVFTAGNNPDTGYVFVEYNGLKDSSMVIVKGITTLNLFPENAVTDNERELVFFNRSFDFEGVSQSASNANITWKIEDSTIGSIEKGVFKGKNQGITKVIAIYDEASDTSQIEVQIGTGEILLNDFEKIGDLSLGGENINLENSTIGISDENFSQGQSSLKLNYEFTYSGTPDTWAYIETNIPVFGVPDTILIDGFTDGKKHLAQINIIDDNGEEFIIRLKRYADNTVYNEYPFLLDDIQAVGANSTFYYPITIKKIGVKLKSDQQTGETYSGTLYFDNMRLSYPSDVNVSNEEEKNIPSRIILDQNYPNPFNPTTEITFRLATTGFTSLKVFDMLGREVSTLVNEKLTSGLHTISFDASNLASGVYIYRLSSKENTLTKRMTLIK
tara:strand:- start:6638 stop:9073 length:2436 start_codon:yes stop_codon:yes gene_type:complete